MSDNRITKRPIRNNHATRYKRKVQNINQGATSQITDPEELLKKPRGKKSNKVEAISAALPDGRHG